MNFISVLIVEDHTMVREALAMMLELEPDQEVVFMAMTLYPTLRRIFKPAGLEWDHAWS